MCHLKTNFWSEKVQFLHSFNDGTVSSPLIEGDGGPALLGRIFRNFVSLGCIFKICYKSQVFHLSALGLSKSGIVSALGCQKGDFVSAPDKIFNCCTALGKNLSVGRHVTLTLPVRMYLVPTPSTKGGGGGGQGGGGLSQLSCDLENRILYKRQLAIAGHRTIHERLKNGKIYDVKS